MGGRFCGCWTQIEPDEAQRSRAREQVGNQDGKFVGKALEISIHLNQLGVFLSRQTMYDSPHQFEPLLPAQGREGPLLAQAHDLARAAMNLAGLSIAPELRSLLRGMNSYYTNRIEGQHTRPHEIEQALRKDFSGNKELAARQRLALAHIEAEVEVEQRFAGDEGARSLYSIEAVRELHRQLFARLPSDDLVTPEGEPTAHARRTERPGLHQWPVVTPQGLCEVDRALLRLAGRRRLTSPR